MSGKKRCRDFSASLLKRGRMVPINFFLGATQAVPVRIENQRKGDSKMIAEEKTGRMKAHIAKIRTADTAYYRDDALIMTD